MKFKIKVAPSPNTFRFINKLTILTWASNTIKWVTTGTLTLTHEETEHFLARMMVGDVEIEHVDNPGDAYAESFRKASLPIDKDPIEDLFPEYDPRRGGMLGQGTWGDKPAPR